MIHVKDDVVCVRCSVEPSSFAHLTHGDRERLDNLLMRHGDHTLTVYLDDPVPDANTATLGYAAPHQTADLRRKRPFIRAFVQQLPSSHSEPHLTLTMPFCTLKPSWNLKSGLLMRTVVTGGQLTMLSLTFT